MEGRRGRHDGTGKPSPIDFVIREGYVELLMDGKWWGIHLGFDWIIEIDGSGLHNDLSTDFHQVIHSLRHQFGMIRVWNESKPHSNPDYITGILLACWLNFDCVIRNKSCLGPHATLEDGREYLTQYKLFMRRVTDSGVPRGDGGNGNSKYPLFNDNFDEWV